MVRVKICGITNVADAQDAVCEGADALGFVFSKSPRRVDVQTVKKIVSATGPFVAMVGVFVNEPVEKMLRIADGCALSAIQLHGDERETTIRQIQKYGFRVIKALRVGAGNELKKINNLPADAFLFDTSYHGKFGGTGRTFDWACLNELKIRVPWIVSGGLNPINVRKLLSFLKPYGVDVSSGVENTPGKKNEKLVKEFIRRVKFSR
jgi:phosphoribosylanthranilate isomerase